MSAPRSDDVSGASDTVSLRTAPPISFWALGAVLLRWRALIAALAVGSGLLAGSLVFLSTRQYVASASFVPQEAPSAQAGFSQLALQLGLTAGRPGTGSPQFYADLLQSREVLRSLVLTTYALDGPAPFRGNLLQYFRIRPQDSSLAVVQAIKQIRGQLLINTNVKTGVVSFEVTTPDPALSARMADRLLELVNEYNLLRRQSQARSEREFVEQRLALAQRSLAVAEDSLSQFYRHNRRFQDAPELVAEEARLQRAVNLQQQLFLTLNQAYESAKIEEVRNTPVITVLGRPTGFVERKARGTVRKAFVALVLGSFLAIGLALLLEHVTKLRQAGDRDFLRFVSLLWDLIPGATRGAAGPPAG